MTTEDTTTDGGASDLDAVMAAIKAVTVAIANDDHHGFRDKKDAMEQAIRAYGEQQRRGALEEAAAMFETLSWEPYTNPATIIRRYLLAEAKSEETT